MSGSLVPCVVPLVPCVVPLVPCVVTAQRLPVQIPGPCTRYARPVAPPFQPVWGLGGCLRFAVAPFCAGIGGPHCWRAPTGPLSRGCGCSWVWVVWDCSGLGTSDASRTPPLAVTNPVQPSGLCSGAPRSLFGGGLCRFRCGRVCCRSRRSLANDPMILSNWESHPQLSTRADPSGPIGGGHSCRPYMCIACLFPPPPGEAGNSRSRKPPGGVVVVVVVPVSPGRPVVHSVRRWPCVSANRARQSA